MGFKGKTDQQKNGNGTGSNGGAAAGGGAQRGPTQNELAKVRELLFGEELREHRTELEKLEEKVVRQVATVRDDIIENIGKLGGSVRSETNKALERCRAEADARKTAIEALVKRFEEFQSGIESRISSLEERSRQAERDLRDQVLSQSRLLSDTITQRFDDAVGLINDGLRDVRSSKMDRSALAALLVNLGTRVDAESASLVAAGQKKG